MSVRDNVLRSGSQGLCVGKGQCVVVRDNVFWSGTMCYAQGQCVGKGHCVLVRDNVRW